MKNKLKTAKEFWEDTEQTETFTLMELYIMYREIRKQERDEVFREVFKKLDEYSCIKNDKWYLDWKAEQLSGVKE